MTDRQMDRQIDRYMVLCLRRQEVSESQTCCRVGRFDVDRLGEDDIHNEVVHSGYTRAIAALIVFLYHVLQTILRPSYVSDNRG